MKDCDSTGLRLCSIQARLFEESLSFFRGSSPIFVRLFMNGEVAKRFDDASILNDVTGLGYRDLSLPSSNGDLFSEKAIRYSRNELHWLGYLYRYWAYTRELESQRIYRLCPASRLVRLYLPLHTQDPEAMVRTIEEMTPEAKPVDINQRFLEGYRKKGLGAKEL
jgi:hypothetical protein